MLVWEEWEVSDGEAARRCQHRVAFASVGGRLKWPHLTLWRGGVFVNYRPPIFATDPICMNSMHRNRQKFAPAWVSALGVRDAREADRQLEAQAPAAVPLGLNGFGAAGLMMVVLMLLAGLSGCNAWQPATYNPPVFGFAPENVPPQSNPLVIQNMDRDLVWDQVVDVVDDYFRVEHEERVRLVGDILTEGRLDTYPRGASTIFEPWNQDSVTRYERWQATLQSMRRRATVYVIPVEGGFNIDVQVYKELEDVPRPESGALSLANSQTLRNDDALIRLTNPVGGQEPTRGWIGLGRDVALEQVILAGIQARTGGTFVPLQPMGQPIESLPPPIEPLPQPF